MVRQLEIGKPTAHDEISAHGYLLHRAIIPSGLAAARASGCTTIGVDRDRERLRDLSAGLLRLHALLLDRERRAYEDRHGPVGSRELLELLLHDAHFAWLRSLSTLMAQIDAQVDADEPVAAGDAQGFFREAYRLLKSGDRGAFQDKYRDALQQSPDVVMTHAGISEVLRSAADPRA